jgi:hypothetical protein
MKIRSNFIFDFFMGMRIEVEVFWAVMPCRVIVGYQHFGGLCCLQLQGEARRRVVMRYDTNVSEDIIASIFRVKCETM